jgi:hypothetical protein
MRKLWQVALAMAVAALPAPIVAQQSDLAQTCPDPALDAHAREVCVAVAQAAESAQPQIGILIAGGNPTPGAAGPGGLRLGRLPPIGVSARVGLTFVRLPNVLVEHAGGEIRQVERAVGIPAPALGTTASVGVYPGITLAPGIGGVGSVDLLGSATWLPFRALGVGNFGHRGASVAYGVGARLGLVRETFEVPAVSVSTMYRRLGSARFGEVCREDHRFVVGPCEGTAGEFGFDMDSWNHRLTVGKRLLGVGLVGGVGYDRHTSDAVIAVRRSDTVGEPRLQRGAARITDGRASGFVNASYTFLLSSAVLEAGWMGGGERSADFPVDPGAFDPRRGTFFGSIAARVAF